MPKCAEHAVTEVVVAAGCSAADADHAYQCGALTWEAVDLVQPLDVVQNGGIPIHIWRTLGVEFGRVGGSVRVVKRAVG